MSTSLRLVVLCSWEVKAGMTRVWWPKSRTNLVKHNLVNKGNKNKRTCYQEFFQPDKSAHSWNHQELGRNTSNDLEMMMMMMCLAIEQIPLHHSVLRLHLHDKYNKFSPILQLQLVDLLIQQTTKTTNTHKLNLIKTSLRGLLCHPDRKWMSLPYSIDEKNHIYQLRW